MAFAREPIKYTNRLKLCINITIGAIVGPIGNLLSIAIMHMAWPWILIVVPTAAWIAGTVFILIGNGNPTPEEVKKTMGETFPGDGHESIEIAKIAVCMDRVWAVEIMSQVAGVRNRARLEQHLLLKTVDEATDDEHISTTRRF